jgi:hypothetical protein
MAWEVTALELLLNVMSTLRVKRGRLKMEFMVGIVLAHVFRDHTVRRL